VSRPLKMNQLHNGNQVSDVQGVGGRVESHIPRYLLRVEHFMGSGHGIVEQTPPTKFFYKIKMGLKRHTYKGKGKLFLSFGDGVGDVLLQGLSIFILHAAGGQRNHLGSFFQHKVNFIQEVIDSL